MPSNTKLYNDVFYKEHLDWQEYYQLISDWILKNTRGEIYGDIGCGNGFIIRNLKKTGKKVWGVDGSDSFMKYVDSSIKKDVGQTDLSKKQELSNCNIAMCMEVAEHINEKYADILVDNIVSTNAHTILFTAATPGQGGTGHINLQPHEYWINKFATRGYFLDKNLSNKFLADLNDTLKGCRWYLDNIMIFKKRNKMVSKIISSVSDLKKNKKKRNSELNFWKNEIAKYVDWYNGASPELYSLKLPQKKETNKGSVKNNAIFTFIEADKNRYLNHLNVKKEFLKGKRVLEIGCGPLPNALAFIDCEIVGLDPLINRYIKAGYPLRDYPDRITYVDSKAEKVPFTDGSFDAVISVNAIDHVDDFEKVASEIKRVLKDDGIMMIETHYHKAKECEPVELNDKIVKEAFSGMLLEKLSDRPFWDFYPNYGEKSERLVVWFGKKIN